NQALTAGMVGVEPAALAQAMSARLNADYELAGQVSLVLTDLLKKRIARLVRRIQLSMGFGALGFLLVLALGWRLIHDITQPLQARVPRGHEPRDSDADEWHHRHDGTRAQHRPLGDAARVSHDGEKLGRNSARTAQRHSRFLQDRSRPPRTGSHRFSTARPA